MEKRKISPVKSFELGLLYKILGRTSLSKNEKWMFDNYWNNEDYEFRKDPNGKLNVHKIKQ
jgi:hypothetical protein